MSSVLLIDHDPDHATALASALAAEGGGAPDFEWRRTLRDGLERVAEKPAWATFLSLSLPDGLGIGALDACLALRASAQVVVLGGPDDEDLGTRAVRHGACDYLLEGHVDRYAFAYALRNIRAREAARRVAFEMSHLARHDALTNLPNRTLFNDRLVQAITLARRRHGHLAVLYLDVDGFKQINDSHGHAVGDLLLKSIAASLLASVRASDTVSRQGGDEFVILLPHIVHAIDAATKAAQIVAALGTTHAVGARRLRVSVSVGISTYPDCGVDAATLVTNADAAMYRAKAHGRDQCQVFEGETDTPAGLPALGDLENQPRGEHHGSAGEHDHHGDQHDHQDEQRRIVESASHLPQDSRSRLGPLAVGGRDVESVLPGEAANVTG